jgi:2-oxo-4-hydroxy-4-carboxy-5-ureidoimidazoline decarboxylase
MATERPYRNKTQLISRAGEIWRTLPEADWMEAFRSHPRIGEHHAERATTATSAKWSAGEQSNVTGSDDEVKRAITDGNRRYEEHFGRIFIICASGKKPAEILENLERRLNNDAATEIKESAAEQEQIMQLRLRKWLAPAEEA